MEIEVRDRRFDLTEVPRDWHPGGRVVSAFFDNLSIFFPAGERFFIASVLAHRDLIEDPKLRRDVDLFCRQEGIHGREHIAYNRMLEAGGVPAKEMEERVVQLIKRRNKQTTKRQQLAGTVALEHFTAMLADILLADESILEGAHPEMVALWQWHAMEEGEHRAVAFDVFEEVGGLYAERCVAMVFTTITFWAKVLEHQVRVMQARGFLWSPLEWANLAKHAFVKPAFVLRMVRPYLSFFRRDFHPWGPRNSQPADGADMREAA